MPKWVLTDMLSTFLASKKLYPTDQPTTGFELYLTYNCNRYILGEEIKFMTPTFIKFGTIIFSILAIAFLAATYVVNGSEKETAWLYIFSIWLVIYSAFIAYPKKKD